MAWAGWFTLCFRHGLVGKLFGFVGFPSPSHVAVLVVFRLGEAQQVGVQVSFDGRQCLWRRLADETGVYECGDVFADRLQHAQQWQVRFAGHGFVDFRIPFQYGDHVMRHRVHGVLVHFAHIEHCVGERFVVGQLVDVGQEPFDGCQLQVFGELLRGLVGGRGEHERFRAEPA